MSDTESPMSDTKSPMSDAESPMSDADRSEAISKSHRHQIWWQLSALVVVSAIAVYAGTAFDEQLQGFLPEQRVLTSIFNKKPSGMSGFSEVLKRVGVTSHAWLLPYRNLRKAHGTLVIVAPSTSLAEFEAEQILNWVHTGNDLIYIDHFSYKMTRRLLEKLHLQVADDSPELHDQSVKVDKTQGVFAHVPALTLTSETTLKGGKPLVSVNDKTIFSELKYGDGRILIGTAPTLCTNLRLSERNNWSNFQFLVNWLATASGDVMFDERCHGFSESGNVFVVLSRSPWGAVFLQVMLILTVGIISASRRFGAFATITNDRKISNLEFIDGLSNAYRRAKANAVIYEITGQALRNRICKLLSLSPHEDAAKIQAAWNVFAESNPLTAGPIDSTVTSFLSDFDSSLTQQKISDAQFKSLISNCDKITEHLNQQSMGKAIQRSGN